MPFFLLSRYFALFLINLYSLVAFAINLIFYLVAALFPDFIHKHFTVPLRSFSRNCVRLHPTVGLKQYYGWKGKTRKKGGYLILMNHSAYYDIPLALSQVCTTMSSALHKTKHLPYLLSRASDVIRAIPLDSGTSTAGDLKGCVEKMAEVLRGKNDVTVFAQAHRFNIFLRPPLSLGSSWLVYSANFPVLVCTHNVGVLCLKGAVLFQSTTPMLLRVTPPAPKGLTLDQFKSWAQETMCRELDWVITETLQNMARDGSLEKARVLHRLGEKHFQDGNVKRAKFYVRNAIAFYPGFPETYFLLERITENREYAQIGKAVQEFWVRMKKAAPREGIEPPTQGSSILCSTD